MNMDCQAARHFAEPFVANQLPAGTRQALAAHLRTCAACSTEMEGVRRLRTATRAAFERTPELQVRPEFIQELTSRLRPNESAHWHGTRRVWLPFLALAASALLLAGAGWFWYTGSIADAALLHTAVRDHVECAIVFKPNRHYTSLEEAGQRYGAMYARLDRVPPSTTNLPGGPLRVVGRHSCVFGGRRFAHIVLSYKEQTVSLLIADDTRHGGATATALVPAAIDGYQVARFSSGGQIAFIVSALSGDDLRDIAAAVHGPVLQALRGA